MATAWRSRGLRIGTTTGTGRHVVTNVTPQRARTPAPAVGDLRAAT